MPTCKVGLAKVDITPRVGVELQGYGPFLCRHSDGLREPLYVRALAMEVDGQQAVIASCDLAGISRDICERVRLLLDKRAGLCADRVLVHAIHTHSGPSIRVYSGWGTPDPPYLELLPLRIVSACIAALDHMQEATISHAQVPCTGIAINRETDAFRAESVEAVMRDDWQPAKPEDTDATCHVVRFDAGNRLLGFLSYYGCHPVIGGSSCKKIHSDWPGIATNFVERLHPGSVGLFLQGAQGDINSCIVGSSEEETMRALDVIAGRYARYILDGLGAASPLRTICLGSTRVKRRFSRKPYTRNDLQALLAEQDEILHAPGASDADHKVRMAMVHVMALRCLIKRLDRGDDLSPSIELHGIRLGSIAFMGSPFEVFRSIKNEVVEKSKAEIPLVMGFCNDSLGYAVDRVAAARGGYAADRVPFICQQLPFANIHDELVDGLLEVDRKLH